MLAWIFGRIFWMFVTGSSAMGWAYVHPLVLLSGRMTKDLNSDTRMASGRWEKPFPECPDRWICVHHGLRRSVYRCSDPGYPAAQ